MLIGRLGVIQIEWQQNWPQNKKMVYELEAFFLLSVVVILL